MSCQTPELVTSERYREVIGHFTSGVTVITTEADGVPFATTASAVSSVSDRPPTVLVCMNRDSETGNAISRSGRFAINILGVEQHELALLLARKGAAKLQGVRLTTGTSAIPILQDALAVLECTATERAIAATHIVHFATVDATLNREGTPLIYFRGGFARLGQALP